MGPTVVFPSGTFNDVTAHPEGWALIVQIGKTWVCYVNGREKWRVEMDSVGSEIRCACDPEGGVLAMAQGDFAPAGDLMACYNGNAPTRLGPTYGRNSVVVEWAAGRFLAYVQVAPTMARKMWLRGSELMESEPYPIPQTSQGFLDIRAGVPLLTDKFSPREVRKRMIVKPSEEGGMVVGQWADKPGMAAFLVDSDVQFTAIDGLCEEPRIASLSDGTYIVSARVRGEGAAFRILFPPWPAEEVQPAQIEPYAQPLYVGPLLGDEKDPGNCYIKKMAPNFSVLYNKETDEAQYGYVEAGTLQELRDIVKEMGDWTDLPLIAGADGNFFPTSIEGAAWVAWEVYPRTPTESVSVIRSRLQTALAQPTIQPRCLIASGYTLNGWYQGGALPLCELAADLAHHPSVICLTYFPGSGRPGGISERPELVPFWNAVTDVARAPKPLTHQQEPDMYIPPPRDMILRIILWLDDAIYPTYHKVYPDLIPEHLDHEGEAAWVCDRFCTLYNLGKTEQQAKEMIEGEIAADLFKRAHPNPPPAHNS